MLSTSVSICHENPYFASVTSSNTWGGGGIFTKVRYSILVTLSYSIWTYVCKLGVYWVCYLFNNTFMHFVHVYTYMHASLVVTDAHE